MNDSINISIQDFLDSHLGRNSDGSVMWSNRPIKHHIAEVIFAKCKNESLCYIQFPDEFSPSIKEPILWDWKSWLSSCDRDERTKNYWAKERIKRFLFEKNVQLVSIAWSEFSGIEPEKAVFDAIKLVKDKNMNKLKAIGIERLLEREEEL